MIFETWFSTCDLRNPSKCLKSVNSQNVIGFLWKPPYFTEAKFFNFPRISPCPNMDSSCTSQHIWFVVNRCLKIYISYFTVHPELIYISAKYLRCRDGGWWSCGIFLHLSIAITICHRVRRLSFSTTNSWTLFTVNSWIPVSFQLKFVKFPKINTKFSISMLKLPSPDSTRLASKGWVYCKSCTHWSRLR